MKPRKVRFLLTLTLTLASCRDGETGLAEDRFVDVMVELRRAAQADSAGFPVARDSILAEHDVTAEDLRAFVRARGDELDELREAWEEIDDHLTTTDTLDQMVPR